MYAAAAAWPMTTLDSSPVMVSLVQVASTVPVFLFALPAGVLADIVDRRRLLIFAETVTTALCAAFAVLVWLRLVTPIALLCFVFLIEAAGAMTAAPWQAVVPLLVPRSELPAAVTMNSVGVNVSRAIGPEWVRGRGLAIYVIVFFGALAVGGLAWGFVARAVGPLPRLRAVSVDHRGWMSLGSAMSIASGLSPRRLAGE
jgi:MFS family permease